MKKIQYINELGAQEPFFSRQQAVKVKNQVLSC